VDYYKFTTTTTGTLNVNLAHDKILNEYRYAYIWLYDSEDNLITYSLFGEDELNLSLQKVGLAAGTYYLIVDSETHSGANYSFETKFAPSKVWETESNEMRVTASKISTNKKYYGTSGNSKMGIGSNTLLNYDVKILDIKYNR
jgi:hypothetical protein